MHSSTSHNISSPESSNTNDQSESSDSSSSIFTATLIPPRSTSRISVDPNAKGAMPSTSILSTFPKLGQCDIFQWKRNVCGYIKAVGLGAFIRASMVPPIDTDALDKFEMQQEQVMLVIRSTLDAVHIQHISSIDDPYLAIIALETRHGVNSGLAAANIIIKIVTSRYDQSTKLEDYVSGISVASQSASEDCVTNQQSKAFRPNPGFIHFDKLTKG